MKSNKNFFCHINKINYLINNIYIIKNISFSISDKPITIISGPNGIGKTTLLKILAGIIKPTSGTIKYQSDYSNQEKSFLFQNSIFFNRTLLENMKYIKKIKKLNSDFDIELEKNLRIFNFFHLLERYPSELSGGELQIFSFIRTLLQNPKILFLDEPFQNLDDNHKKMIEAIIENISHTCKIIMISHDHSILPKSSIENFKFNNDCINQV